MKTARKVNCSQKQSDSWAIRKPMHKETVYGEINLRRTTTATLKAALEKSSKNY